MDPKDVELLLQSRRSIRKYRDTPPPDRWLEAMIRCALHAPSPSNSQPVRFVRFTSSESRHRLQHMMDEARKSFLARIAEYADFKRLRNIINFTYRHSVFMFDAPILMAAGTTAEPSGLTGHLSRAGLICGQKKDNSDLDISLGLAVKGFALKAHSLGLGTCILTAPLHFISDLDQVLPHKKLQIKCFLTVGFPEHTPKQPPRKAATDIYREI
jgi:nitroreductase